MKFLFISTTLLTALSALGAEPQPFTPAPLQLAELPFSARYAAPILSGAESASPVSFLIGPPFQFRKSVRIDYGIPLQPRVQSDAQRGYHFLDAPGAGYREQRDRINNK